MILKRTKCFIAHIESEQHDFFIQDDAETVTKIAELIENKESSASTLSLDEVKQLEPNTIVIARYDDIPFRGIIKSGQTDDNVDICFVDFGNINPCPSDSLKSASEELRSFPYQAKHCRLHGIPSNEIGKAFDYLGDNSDEDTHVEYSIISEKNQIYNVLVYIKNQCVNEKFGYDPNNDQAETDTKEEKVPSVEKEEQKVPSVQEEEQVPPVEEQEQTTPVTEEQTKEDEKPSETVVEEKTEGND